MKNLNERPEPSDNQVNLRRLLFFHHATAREAAAVIGISEQAISGWLKGTRTQGTATLFRIAQIYDVDPRAFSADPVDFAQLLADPERIREAEWNIEGIKRGKNLLKAKPRKKKATVTELRSRRKS